MRLGKWLGMRLDMVLAMGLGMGYLMVLPVKLCIGLDIGLSVGLDMWLNPFPKAGRPKNCFIFTKTMCKLCGSLFPEITVYFKLITGRGAGG